MKSLQNSVKSIIHPFTLMVHAAILNSSNVQCVDTKYNPVKGISRFTMSRSSRKYDIKSDSRGSSNHLNDTSGTANTSGCNDTTTTSTTGTTTPPIIRQTKHSKWNTFFSSSSSSSLNKTDQKNLKAVPTLTTTPSSSFRRRSRLLSSSSSARLTNSGATNNYWNSTSSSISGIIFDSKNSGTPSATSWTIDDALRSLYDENYDHSTHPTKPTGAIHDSIRSPDGDDDSNIIDTTCDNDDILWWKMDEGTYYTTVKMERNFMKRRKKILPPDSETTSSDIQVPDNSDDDEEENMEDYCDDNEKEHLTTMQLFHELHSDPLIEILETIVQNEIISNQSTEIDNEDDITENADNHMIDDEFGDFQSADVESYTTTVTDSAVVSTPLVQVVEDESNVRDRTLVKDETEITNGEEILCHHSNEVLLPPRAISFDDEDNEELMQYVDSIILSTPKPTNATTLTNHTSSSIDTPDLVRFVDDIIDAATTAALTKCTTDVRSEDKCQDNDQHKEVEPNDSSSHHLQRIQGTNVAALSPPLSMQLPVGNDLSTLESRFIRRLQHMYHSGHDLPAGSDSTHAGTEDYNMPTTPMSTYPDLPAYYFTSPDLDDTVSVLQSMPWEYVFPSNTRGVGSFDKEANSIEDCEEAWAMWDEYITARLCHLDTALKDIQADTLLQIQPHKERIARTNILIHEWDQNVRLSIMYCDRSQQAINSLIGVDDEMIGLIGPSILLQIFEQRDEYRHLSLILDRLHDIWAGERDIMNRIDRFDVKSSNALDEYFTVMKLAKELDCRVSDAKLTQLHCVESLRDRLKSIGMRFWVRLLDIAKSIVVKTCRDKSCFDRNQYERVLRAMLDLKSQSIVDQSVASIDLSTSWTDNLLSAESYEVDRAFASALLEPTDYETSSHETELKQFNYELDLHWGDYATLRGMLHNLVTVRFDFEWQFNYLPRVFHRLCKCLTDILLSHSMLVKWHRDSMCCFSPSTSMDQMNNWNVAILHSDLKSIYDSMSAHTSKLWEHCEGIMAKCFDEYLNFAPKSPLFKRGTNGTEDILWRDDLARLQNVYALANTFVSIKKPLLELNKCDQSNTGTQLFSPKMVSIFKRHVRAVHVEAMNTLGRCLANESWNLGSFVVSAEPERTDQPELSIEAILLRAVQAALRRSEPVSNVVKKTICELSCSYDARSLVTRLEANENPFDVVASSNVNGNGINESFSPENDVELSDHTVYRTLSSFIHENDGSIRLAPEAVSRELIVWFARLLLVLEKLPVIAEDISNVFINLCDLYFTTVFRLCSGNTKNERLILGKESPILMQCSIEESRSDDKASGAQLFGSFRNSPKKTGSGKYAPRRLIIPGNLDAEICFPRPRYATEASELNTFIDRAQQSLRDAVNLDMIDSWLVDPTADSPEEQGCEVARVLVKREGSISSCYTVAALIEVAQKVARQNQSSLLPQELYIDRDLSSLRLYSQTVLDVVPKLARVARQIACTRAVAGGSVVKYIIKVDTGWEECKLHEYANDYIDELSYRCSLIWGYLAASNKLPLIIMRETWEGIVSAAYLSLLDGFARIRQCSTEGRSLMALDLATFKAGLSPSNIADRLDGVVIVNKPPPINPEVNFFFVETYIKVFYYPTDDVLNWIKDNCDKYTLNHCVGLALAVFLSNQDEKSEGSFNDIVKSIKALYTTDEKRESISIHQV